MDYKGFFITVNMQVYSYCTTFSIFTSKRANSIIFSAMPYNYRTITKRIVFVFKDSLIELPFSIKIINIYKIEGGGPKHLYKAE